MLLALASILAHCPSKAGLPSYPYSLFQPDPPSRRSSCSKDIVLPHKFRLLARNKLDELDSLHARGFLELFFRRRKNLCQDRQQLWC